ncbi:MAG: FAD-binding oxidoreductase [Jiangellaceae bacterium]
MLLSIKGGGHNIAGTSIAEGCLTLAMFRMREITVDPEARLAHAGPGCLLGEVDRGDARARPGHTVGFISEVGVASLIVTADDEIRTANRDENADLFWALRGGGGNLGVVTRFTSREVVPTVFGGLIAWPFERADEILRAYRTMTSEAPRELAVWMILLHAPPMPFVPEWHGRKACSMVVCYSGELERAHEVLAPIRGRRGDREPGRPLHDGRNGMWDPDEPDADSFGHWIRDAW